MSDQIFNDWLATRPESIQKLAKKYPPGIYKMKDGAPYSISCGGTLVHLESYRESGEIGVVVMSKDKLPACTEHEKQLCKQHGTNFEEAHALNIFLHVDPIHVEWYSELK